MEREWNVDGRPMEREWNKDPNLFTNFGPRPAPLTFSFTFAYHASRGRPVQARPRPAQHSRARGQWHGVSISSHSRYFGEFFVLLNCEPPLDPAALPRVSRRSSRLQLIKSQCRSASAFPRGAKCAVACVAPIVGTLRRIGPTGVPLGDPASRPTSIVFTAVAFWETSDFY